MKNISIILKKELRAYFNSPIAYIVIVLFLMLSGYFFSLQLFVSNNASVRPVIDLMPLMFLFFVPAITMRLFSEEIKSGTIEILSTLPLKEEEIILGKYLSAVALIAICVITTLFYPFLVFLLGRPDLGQIFSAYMGTILIGSTFAAIGIFCSSISKNQIISFIAGFVICFVFYIIGQTAMFLPGLLADIANYTGISAHFENFTRGVADTRDILYFLSIITLFLYATLAVLKTKK
ncbi:MAG: hypothetical protein A2252_00255 [Elusimicrobia bacterium RIFOXYA2_FULL_39_19]|nr:MAG: hypothetical protein A2252_00255 [Elusimicrobia bacterium RIFOXYA2_FULL_39_19]